MADRTDGYEFGYSFNGMDDGYGPVSCGKSECGFGSYVKVEGRSETHSPGCSECGVLAVNLMSLFDPSQAGYEGPVDNNFQVAAAVELVRRSNSSIKLYADKRMGLIDGLRAFRIDALREIVRIAKEAGVVYEGLMDDSEDV